MLCTHHIGLMGQAEAQSWLCIAPSPSLVDLLVSSLSIPVNPCFPTGLPPPQICQNLSVGRRRGPALIATLQTHLGAGSQHPGFREGMGGLKGCALGPQDLGEHIGDKPWKEMGPGCGVLGYWGMWDIGRQSSGYSCPILSSLYQYYRI